VCWLRMGRSLTGHPERKAYIGGFSVLDVPSREEALERAAKIDVVCRCPQEVREFLPDPAVGLIEVPMASSCPRLPKRTIACASVRECPPTGRLRVGRTVR
jgi:hypothetical protein